MKNKPLYIILTVSIVVVGLVGLLLFTTSKLDIDAPWLRYLPTFHACLNALTAFCLVLGLVYVKKGEIELHRNMMTVSFILGAIFLLSYVTYHASQDSTIFGDVNGDSILSESESVLVASSRLIYIILLLSHIGMSILVIPFVLFAFYYALDKNFVAHKKVVKWTWPIWFYVSVTGVLVYLMISPYYQ